MPALRSQADQAVRQELAERFDAELSGVLRGATEVALVNFPNHGNPGDSAIWLGAEASLARLGVRVRYRCAWCTFSPGALKAALPDGPVLINGGGNFGDLYKGQQGLRERLLKQLRDRHIIQLPQSIHFRDPKNLARVQKLVAGHGDVTLMLRERPSLAFAQQHFDAETALAPDCALALGELIPQRPGMPETDVLWLHRLLGDPEYVDHASLPGDLTVREVEWLRAVEPEPTWSRRHAAGRRANALLLARARADKRWARYAWRPLAATFTPLGEGHVQRGLTILGRGRVLVTDKLHGHLMALLAGIPHVVLDNSYGKVSGTYDTWTHPSSIAHWADSGDEAMDLARSMLDPLTTPDKPVPIAEEPVVFAYWNGPDREILTDFLAEWEPTFPRLRILDDDDVIEMLGRIRPDAADLYRRIRFPSARSDLARLAGLHELGGLYIDTHVGLRDERGLRRLLEQWQRSPAEMLIWDRSREAFPRPPNERRPVSTVTAAKAGSPTVRALLDGVMDRLLAHSDAEAEHGHVDYNVWYLVGAGSWRAILHDPEDGNTTLRPQFRGKVTYTGEEVSPVEMWRHVAYKKSAAHWTQRQQVELLLDPKPA